MNHTAFFSLLLLAIMFKFHNAFAVVGKSLSPRFRSSSRKLSKLPVSTIDKFPLSPLDNFPASFNLFDLLNNFDVMPSLSTTSANQLKLDVKETDKAFEVTVDIPGVDKKDVNVSVKNQNLEITAHREEVREEEKDNYRRMERFSGQVYRSLRLPENVLADQIEAHSDNGVLHITVPKTEHKEDVKTIEIK